MQGPQAELQGVMAGGCQNTIVKPKKEREP